MLAEGMQSTEARLMSLGGGSFHLFTSTPISDSVTSRLFNNTRTAADTFNLRKHQALFKQDEKRVTLQTDVYTDI